MGMVINLGTNDQYFIFRGSDAREFIAGLAKGDECLFRNRLMHESCADQIAGHVDDNQDPGIPKPGM